MIRVTYALFFGSVMLLPAQKLVQPPEQAPDRAMAEAAAQLAARTSSLLPRRPTVSLEMQNLTSLSPAEWSSFRTQLSLELRKAGLETVAGTSPDSRLRVTLSESARGLLLVAEVWSGDNRQVVMLPWKASAPADAKPRSILTKQLLITQAEPILDLLLIDSNTRMLVLNINQVVSYRLTGGKWTPGDTAALVLPRPLPRDPRGRLAIASDGLRAYLPGATCTGTVTPELKLTCATGNENWPDTQARWITDRNLLESGAARTPFYAVANGIFATVEGGAQDRAGQPIQGADGWGSDIAALEDPCGAGTAIIASATNTEREELRVYEITNGQATAASDAMPLAGPVTALWPAESRGQATLVIRNPQTGEYEASRLGLACAE
jgi:hypothetical protein